MAQQREARFKGSRPVTIPLLYRIFFLWIEPSTTFLGAYVAHFMQQEYLKTTHAATAAAFAATTLPVGISVVLSQLANMYFYFALNQSLLLRSTADLKVWRTVFCIMLVTDVGHLYSLKELGTAMYWHYTGWTVADWMNYPYMYLAMTMRIAFVMGVGLSG
jgi:hypothetical protein